MELNISERTRETGSALLGIANEVVRVYKEQFGRGPTKCHCNFARSDTFVCVLEESLTPAERNLAERGQHRRIQEMRMFVHEESIHDLKSPVEGLLGRRVRSVVGGIDVENDIAVEVFVLEPVNESD